MSVIDVSGHRSMHSSPAVLLPRGMNVSSVRMVRHHMCAIMVRHHIMRGGIIAVCVTHRSSRSTSQSAAPNIMGLAPCRQPTTIVATKNSLRPPKGDRRTQRRGGGSGGAPVAVRGLC